MAAAIMNCYSLHGLNLAVKYKQIALSDEIKRLFNFLPFEKCEKFNSNSHIVITFSASQRPVDIPSDRSKPYIVNDISIYDTNKSVFITDGYSTFRISKIPGEGNVSFHPSFKNKSKPSKYNFFLLGLTYLFSHHGLFDLHGAALAGNGSGYLLVGESCSGKSTTALSLVNHGWNYASDDSLLLKSNGDVAEVLSFRKDFYVDPIALSKYPEIAHAIQEDRNQEAAKCFIDLENVFPDQFQGSIIPIVLIILKITSNKNSTLQKVNKAQAFAKLLKQSISIFFNRQVVGEHFNALKLLVNQSDCYELFAGGDLYHNPERILEIIPRKR